MCVAISLDLLLRVSLLCSIALLLSYKLRRTSAASHVMLLTFAFAGGILLVIFKAALTAPNWGADTCGLLLGLTWIGGSIVALIVSASHLVASTSKYRRSRPVSDKKRLEVADRMRRELSLGNGFELRELDSGSDVLVLNVPVPTILLPPESAAWDSARLQMVLYASCAELHESRPLAVLRVSLAAIYWFHPLAWWLNRRARFWSQCAADDQLLNAGVEPRRLADAIFQAGSRVRERFGLISRSGARARDVRLLAVLERGRARGCPGLPATRLTAGAALALTLALTAVPLRWPMASGSALVGENHGTNTVGSSEGSSPAIRSARMAAALRKRLVYAQHTLEETPAKRRWNATQDEAIALQVSLSKLYPVTSFLNSNMAGNSMERSQ